MNRREEEEEEEEDEEEGEEDVVPPIRQLYATKRAAGDLYEKEIARGNN